MPISFACACGKSFNVADEFAGKRTKCPACGAGLTVPAPAAAEPEPEPAKSESEEDAAYRALMESPDPELSASPPRRESEDRPLSRPSAPAAAPIPSARKPKLRKASPEERKARKQRASRQHDPDRLRKRLYMIGGVLMVLFGGAIGFFSINEGISIRGGVFGFFTVIGGISTFFQGVTGNFDDE